MEFLKAIKLRELSNDDALTKILVQDGSTGDIKYRTAASIGGGTIDAVPVNGSTNAVQSDGVFDALALKQATLVSGTNIKTIDTQTILGAGDFKILPFFYRWAWISVPWSSTTISVFGFGSPTVSGTPTARAFATTNLLASTRRIGYQSSATAGQMAAVRSNISLFWRGNSAGLGGFDCAWIFGLGQTQTGYFFHGGLTFQTGAPGATTLPSTLTNVVGISFTQGTDTFFQFMHNDGSGTTTTSSTGVTPSTTTMYKLRVYCTPNASSIFIEFTDLSVGTKVSYEATTNIPASTQDLTHLLVISNNATAASVWLEFAELVAGTPT